MEIGIGALVLGIIIGVVATVLTFILHGVSKEKPEYLEAKPIEEEEQIPEEHIPGEPIEEPKPKPPEDEDEKPEPPVEEPPVEEEPPIEEPEYEPIYKVYEYDEPEGEKLFIKYIECPETIKAGEKFYLKVGWKSTYTKKIEYQGSLQRLKYYKPVVALWKGMFLEPDEDPVGVVYRTYPCKGGIDKDTTWKFLFGIWDGKKYVDEDTKEVKVRIE